ncbi:hypothetical protein GUJ93_ZPchr0005g14866 [Zizania palustris]|uniref:Uncharacterized protein n=1 Tax=Zizania palustris TaxID=103762 RepID=A0A8J5VIF1_ZIZPA|nr:hypothetical protein GUJ93_ZPchr0005g14866 [Zizania palustris]
MAAHIGTMIETTSRWERWQAEARGASRDDDSLGRPRSVETTATHLGCRRTRREAWHGSDARRRHDAGAAVWHRPEWQLHGGSPDDGGAPWARALESSDGAWP